jgi:hypothetical protein
LIITFDDQLKAWWWGLYPLLLGFFVGERRKKR